VVNVAKAPKPATINSENAANASTVSVTCDVSGL
jgi:hypothetical protein